MNKNKKIAFMCVLSLIVLLPSVFFVYVFDYYRAEDVAIAVMQSEADIRVVDNLTILSPATPTNTALIFYPGAKVEYLAYLPLLEKLRQNGIACVLVKMPFNLAIFNSDAADEVFDQLPDVQHWFIGGHSMGGVMASSYAAKHGDKVKGVILLGAYIYGDVSPANALTIYGTLNAELEKHMDYTEHIVVIEGGNHAQFGNYGPQKGDPPATISREEQQDIAVQAILDFIIEKSQE